MSFVFSLVPTLTLFVMMLAMGMTLRTEDFARVVTRPKAFAVGAFGQLVALPAAAFAIARALELRPEVAIGLMLIAACPGGVTSDVVADLARGDTALSILLTAFSSLVAFLTVPIVVNLGLIGFGVQATEIRLPLAETALKLFSTTALPVFVGMAVLAYRPLLAARWQRPLLYSSAGILILLILALGFRMMLEDLSGVLDSALPVALLVTTMTLLGLGAARALRIDAAQGRTIAIEIGLQNFNLAMVLALSILHEERYLGPALLYLPTMFGAATIVILASRFRSGSSPAAGRIEASDPL